MDGYLCVKLKELRLEKGFSKEDLAYKLKISPYKLARLENLTSKATICEMASLIYYLDAKLNYITGESSVRKFPIDLPYDEYEFYEKLHNKIKKKKRK